MAESFKSAMRVVSPLAWLREFWPVPLIGVLYVAAGRHWGWISVSPAGSFASFLVGSYGYFAITRLYRSRASRSSSGKRGTRP